MMAVRTRAAERKRSSRESECHETAAKEEAARFVRGAEISPRPLLPLESFPPLRDSGWWKAGVRSGRGGDGARSATLSRPRSHGRAEDSTGEEHWKRAEGALKD